MLRDKRPIANPESKIKDLNLLYQLCGITSKFLIILKESIFFQILKNYIIGEKLYFLLHEKIAKKNWRK